MGWNVAPGVAGSPVVKKVVRIDVPVDKYPNVCTACIKL
jgi:protein quaking